MKLAEFKTILHAHAGHRLGFVLPDGTAVAPDFHVTEVGHVARRFIDCGGTLRRTDTCLLQAWVAPADPEHRLTAGKLTRILELSAPLLPDDSLDVELEHGDGPVSQYAVDRAEAHGDELQFQLANKKTDCLAREACGLEPTPSGCGCGAGQCC